MLKRIYADNFRALVNFEFRPARLNLLLGENGSGKTSVFDVLGKIKDAVLLGTPVADLYSLTRTIWNPREVQRFELDIELEGNAYRYALEIEHPSSTPGRPFIRTEEVTVDGSHHYRFAGGEATLYQEARPPAVFPFTAERSFLQNIDVESQRHTPKLLALKRFLAGLWILQPNPFNLELFSQQEQYWLERDGRNLASFFSFLNAERPTIRTELENRLQQALPEFRNFSLRRAGNQKALIANLNLVEERVVELPAIHLSEGQRVLILLYAALLGLLDTGAPLCFDEPDNFVSLTEIQPWLQLLRDTVDARGGQAMVISHHPEVMDYMAVDSVWVFDRPSGHVRAQLYEPARVPENEALKLSEIVARGM